MATSTQNDVVTRALPARLGRTSFPVLPLLLTFLPFVLPILLIVGATPAQTKNCNRTTTGLVPLMDMGATKYKNFVGGLYNGTNTMPAAHAAFGAGAAKAVQPLDSTGKPSTTGKIVLVSIGMSNTTQEFTEFLKISNADPKRNKAVKVVDLAQGGHDARKVAQPNHKFWTTAATRLTKAGVTPQQVQVAWVKEAIASPTKLFPNNAIELRDLLAQIARNLKAKYPNILICYVSSRIYAGYAGTKLNPEPYAYEGGFATKWLIEQQINGDKTLNHDRTLGTVVAPWLAWGPYLWGDGLNKRSDGLIWECSDFANDGTHPATSGRKKVAVMLNNHFTTDPTAKVWYGGTPGGGTGLAEINPYGKACAGSVGALRMRWNSMPTLGNTSFALGMVNGAPSSLTLFYFSAGKASIPLQGCELLVDVAQIFFQAQMTASTNGTAIQRFSIPNNPVLTGLKVYAQWINQDSKSQNLAMIGGGAATQGAEVVLGR